MESKNLLDQALTFIPEEWRQALSRGNLLPEHATGAVLFADITGFTATAEALTRVFGLRSGAEELLTIINTIFDRLILEIDRFSGSVISFSGDAITCWFDNDLDHASEYANGAR